MENKIGFDGFAQICLVVENIEEVAKKWADIFGVPVPEVEIHGSEPIPSDKLTYRQKPADYKIKFVCIEAGGFVVELTEPIEGESTFKEFLESRGPGVHHLGFQVGGRRDAIVNELEQEKGYDLRTVGYYPGSSWTVIDTEQDLGVNLNIKPVA